MSTVHVYCIDEFIVAGSKQTADSIRHGVQPDLNFLFLYSPNDSVPQNLKSCAVMGLMSLTTC